MAKLKSVSPVISASEALNVTAPTGTLNLHSLPMEIFTANFANSVKGDKPKVILELAVPIQGVGTVQIFAPSYLSFDDQRAYLAEYFTHGMTINGADNQPEYNADGTVEGLFFKAYEIGGSNYEIVTAEAALSKMKATGLNSSVMQFGKANTKLSREQVETATSLQRGNYAKVAVQQEGGVMGWLSNVLK